LKYADSLGINYVVDQLQAFEKAYGSRFAPCELLLSMRQSNQTFYK
jgi:3-hydroxyacyl-CoA dehydrogenase/enoyl-CoA hydratase/3-hydroxybutyryl-CoA epimerase